MDDRLKWLTKISFRGPIGIGIVVLGFAFLFSLLFVNIPKENKDVLLFCAGIVLALMKDVSGFYFGGSKDKADSDKADHVKSIMGPPDKK